MTDVNNTTFNAIQAQFIDIIEENKNNLTSQEYINIYNKINFFTKKSLSSSNINTHTHTINIPLNINTPININTSRNVNTPRNRHIIDTTIIDYLLFIIAGPFLLFFQCGGGIVLKELFGKHNSYEHFISILYTINIYVFYVIWCVIFFYILLLLCNIKKLLCSTST